MRSEDKPPLDELAHHGVKGMKWGVTKDDSFTVNKGSSIQTVTAKTEANLDRRLYGAFTDQDKELYRSGYATRLKQLVNTDDIRVTNLVLTKDLKVASEAQAYSAFRTVLETDRPGMAKALAASYTEAAVHQQMISSAMAVKTQKIAEKHLTKKGEAWMSAQGNNYFQTAIGSLRSDSDLAGKYYDELTRQGFDAFLDSNDRKAGYSEAPIVIIKPKSVTKKAKSVPLTQNDIINAQNKYFAMRGWEPI